MKIVIAGIGKVGASLTRQLCDEGNDLTLIDLDAAVLEATMEQHDVMAVVGIAQRARLWSRRALRMRTF